MPRYYFHTESEFRHTFEAGTELPDMEAARVEAARVGGEILKDGAHHFWGSQPWTLTCTDEEGLIFFTLVLHGENTENAAAH
jgi:hypothetical protein